MRSQNHHLINQYQQSNVETPRNSMRSVIRLTICIVIYIATAGLHAKIADTSSLRGIIAQFQVLISIVMLLGTHTHAHVFSISINALNSIYVLFAFLRHRNPSIIPGIFVPLMTIVVVIIIHYFSNKRDHKFNEAIERNDQLGILYEEVVATEEALEEKNKLLQESIEQMRLNEEKLTYLAFFDSLTELPNRKMLLDRLELLIKVSEKEKMQFALIFIDLDNFKKVNDILGHVAGDVLLQNIVERLKTAIHREDLFGRLCGDEFALIVQRPYKETDLVSYAQQIRDVLKENFYIEDRYFNISASFGIAQFPQNGHSAIEIMKAADTAMFNIKKTGRDGIQFFNYSLQTQKK